MPQHHIYVSVDQLKEHDERMDWHVRLIQQELEEAEDAKEEVQEEEEEEEDEEEQYEARQVGYKRGRYQTSVSARARRRSGPRVRMPNRQLAH